MSLGESSLTLTPPVRVVKVLSWYVDGGWVVRVAAVLCQDWRDNFRAAITYTNSTRRRFEWLICRIEKKTPCDVVYLSDDNHGERLPSLGFVLVGNRSYVGWKGVVGAAIA